MRKSGRSEIVDEAGGTRFRYYSQAVSAVPLVADKDRAAGCEEAGVQRWGPSHFKPHALRAFPALDLSLSTSPNAYL